MKKTTTIWLITAAALILAGGILWGGAMTMMGWNFSGLSTGSYETSEYMIDEDVQDVSVIADTADIRFLPAEGEAGRVVCYERTNAKHAVEVKDGKLTIKLNDTRKWYEHIGILTETPAITVYLPAGQYQALSVKSSTGDVEIASDFQFVSVDVSVSTGDVRCFASASDRIDVQTSTGAICLQDVTASLVRLTASTGKITAERVVSEGDVVVKVSTGKVLLTDVSCCNLMSSGDTGSLKMTRVIATGHFSIERSTGDVTFDACDAAEITVTTDTGDVGGSLLSDKVFDVHTDTGRKDVPQTTTGGRCIVTTDTGNIKITIQP